MSDIRSRLDAAREAARRLREAQRDLNDATAEQEGQQAAAAVEAARSDLNRLNTDLNRLDGRTVAVDGNVVEGFPDEVEVDGRAAIDEAPGVDDRRFLRQEGVETADLGAGEAAKRAAEIRQQQREQTEREFVEKQTGKPFATLAPEEVTKAVRDVSLEQSGAADLLRETTRPGLGDPLDLDAEDIRDDLDALATRDLVGGVLGKDPRALTPADFRAFDKRVVDAALEGAGLDPTTATRLERMRVESALRNDAFDVEVAKRLRAEAEAARNQPTDPAAGGGATPGAPPPPPPDQTAPPPPPTGGGAGAGSGGGSGDGPIGGGGEFGAGGGGATGPGSPEVAPPTPGATAGLAPDPGVGDATGGPAVGSEPTGTQVDTVFEASFGEMTFDPNPSGLDSGAGFETFHRAANGEWFDDRGNRVTDPTEIDRLEQAFNEFEAAGGTMTPGSISTTGRTREQAASDAPTGGGGGSDTSGSGGDEGSDDEGSGGGGSGGGGSGGDADADADGGGSADDGSGGDADDGGSGGDAGGTPDDAESGAGLTPDPESAHEFRIDLHSEFVGRMRESRLAQRDPLVQEGTPVPEGADTGFMGGGANQLPPPLPGVGNPGSLDATRFRPEIDEPLSALTPVGGAINPGRDGESPSGEGRELDPLAGLGDTVATDPDLTVPGRDSVADGDSGTRSLPAFGTPVLGGSLTGSSALDPAVSSAPRFDFSFGGGANRPPGPNDPIAAVQAPPDLVPPPASEPDAAADEPMVVVDSEPDASADPVLPSDDPAGDDLDPPPSGFDDPLDT